MLPSFSSSENQRVYSRLSCRNLAASSPGVLDSTCARAGSRVCATAPVSRYASPTEGFGISSPASRARERSSSGCNAWGPFGPGAWSWRTLAECFPALSSHGSHLEIRALQEGLYARVPRRVRRSSLAQISVYRSLHCWWLSRSARSYWWSLLWAAPEWPLPCRSFLWGCLGASARAICFASFEL